MSKTRTQAWRTLVADGADGPTMEHPIQAIPNAIVFKKGECMLNGGTRSSVNVSFPVLMRRCKYLLYSGDSYLWKSVL